MKVKLKLKLEIDIKHVGPLVAMLRRSQVDQMTLPYDNSGSGHYETQEAVRALFEQLKAVMS